MLIKLFSITYLTSSIPVIMINSNTAQFLFITEEHSICIGRIFLYPSNGLTNLVCPEQFIPIMI